MGIIRRGLFRSRTAFVLGEYFIQVHGRNIECFDPTCRPLLPSTCQSVRMDFLALAPGVHSIDTLTLTDVQTGFTMNLR